jgi:hypothetical protein
VPLAKNTSNDGSYIWRVPFFDANGNQSNADPLSAKMLSLTGYGADIRATTDSSGQVNKIIVFDGGTAYTNDIGNDFIYVEDPTVPGNIPNRHEVEPIVIDSALTGARLPAFASNPIGFLPLPISTVTWLEFKIEDANDETNYQILQNGNNVTVTGNVTVGSTTLNMPGINTNIAIGMVLLGQGIQVGTTITNIVGTVVTLSLPATSNYTGNFIAQPVTPAIITIE